MTLHVEPKHNCQKIKTMGEVKEYMNECLKEYSVSIDGQNIKVEKTN